MPITFTWIVSPSFRTSVTLAIRWCAISDTCKRDAGSVEEARVRVVLGDDGKVTASVQLHEPGATAALRACIDRQLADATLPGAKLMRKRSLALTFKR